MFYLALAVIGSVYVAYRSFYLLQPVLIYFVLKYFLSKRKSLKKAGEWIVVTGATDGIGKAFVEVLAEDGFNIFLISRTKSKLEGVAKDLEARYNINTRIFVADFTKNDFSYAEMARDINNLSTVACLINNAGISYTHADDLLSSKFLDTEYCSNILDCNAKSMTAVTRTVLSKLTSDPQPPSGIHRYIINIGSSSGLFITPYLSIYGASKAYARYLTEALGVELKNTCVRTQMFAPFYVMTKLTGIRRSSLKVPTATAFAKSALSVLGIQQVCCGYFIHDMQLALMNLMPEWMKTSMVTGEMIAARKKFLRRAAAKKD